MIFVNSVTTALLVTFFALPAERTLFDDRFETFVADTSVSKGIHYNLRYQIYCLQKRFENPAAFPDDQETDVYDKNSVHFIVRHRESGYWVGAMRLILSVPAQLPLARLCSLEIDTIKSPHGKLVAEASRLCVLPAPALQLDRNVKSADFPDFFHPSYVSLGLIRAAREYCLTHDIRFSFFLVTDQLARILRRVGMEINAVGPSIQHRGLRRPYIHDNIEGYKRMREKSPLVYEMFQASPPNKYYSKIRPLRASQTVQLFV